MNYSGYSPIVWPGLFVCSHLPANTCGENNGTSDFNTVPIFISVGFYGVLAWLVLGGKR
jgi:hypothetical protein